MNKVAVGPMKIAVSACLLLFGWLSLHGCGPQAQETAAPADTTLQFDSSYAARLGADDYGMKRYVMAFLKAGPNHGQDSTETVQLQQAHMANINRLAEEGTLVLAGPFLDDGALRGIYVFDVETVEEARELTASDPAIQAGRLEMELHPWYGTAGLPALSEIHERIARESF